MTSKTHNYDAIKESIVGAGATIGEVIKHMDYEAAIVVDEEGRLLGLVTDGDLRRAFLGGADFDTPVADVMTRDPLSISSDLTREEKVSIFLGKKIRHLPIIDDDHRLLGLEMLRDQYDDFDFGEAVLMAGGKGTRLRPLTQNIPKPLLNVGDKTILDNLLLRLREGGLRDVIISVNYLGDKIRRHVNDGREHGVNVAYVEEEKPLGTAGSLSLIDPRPSKSFVVMNADLITEFDFRAFSRFHREHGNDMTVCVRKIAQKIPFGVVDLNDELTDVVGIREKPECHYLVNAGIYMIEPEIIDLIPKNEFFDMVSLINKAMENDRKVGAFPVFEYWRDVGRHEEMNQARREWLEKNENGQSKAEEVTS